MSNKGPPDLFCRLWERPMASAELRQQFKAHTQKIPTLYSLVFAFQQKYQISQPRAALWWWSILIWQWEVEVYCKPTGHHQYYLIHFLIIQVWMNVCRWLVHVLAGWIGHVLLWQDQRKDIKMSSRCISKSTCLVGSFNIAWSLYLLVAILTYWKAQVNIS